MYDILYFIYSHLKIYYIICVIMSENKVISTKDELYYRVTVLSLMLKPLVNKNDNNYAKNMLYIYSMDELRKLQNQIDKHISTIKNYLVENPDPTLTEFGKRLLDCEQCLKNYVSNENRITYNIGAAGLCYSGVGFGVNALLASTINPILAGSVILFGACRYWQSSTHENDKEKTNLLNSIKELDNSINKLFKNNTNTESQDNVTNDSIDTTMVQTQPHTSIQTLIQSQ